MKRKVSCGELSLGIALLWLPHIVKAVSETDKSTRKSWKLSSTLARSFQQEHYWETDAMPDVNFALSGNNKNQLRDFNIYLNEKVITTINSLDGWMLGDNLIMCHQVDYMPSALIPSEAVENNQEHFVANKLGSIASLVSYSLCLRDHSYVWIEYFLKILNLKSLWRRTSIWLHVINLDFLQSGVQINVNTNGK